MCSVFSRAFVFALAITVIPSSSGFCQDTVRRAATASSLPDAFALLGHSQIVAAPKEDAAILAESMDGQQQGVTSATGPVVSPSAAPICGITHLGSCIRDLAQDEKGIFTSPFRLQPKDAYWLMPLGAATGLAFAYDAEAAKVVGVDPNRANIANNISNFGSFYATGAESAGVYFLGLAQKNPKLAETGRLSAEAILASGTVTIVTKMASNRQRPLQGNGQGDFWADGTAHWQFDSSFPSDHATASMALARVVAGEYPHWYVVLPAYGFAESVGIARILANQHFPSDVLVGQAIGFLSGGYVLRHHALFLREKNTFASRLMDSIQPISDPRVRAVGFALSVPLGR
jgi:membrane-associated phospholipid phosphatase